MWINSSSPPEQSADLPAQGAPLNVQTLVMSNPEPEQLVRAAKERPGAYLFVHYTESAFIELVEKARSRATNALMLLNSSWGCLADGPFGSDLFQPSLHAQVGSLVLCRPPALGCFLKSRKERVSRLAERFLFMAADTKSSEWHAEPSALFKASLQAWRDLVFRVGDACRSVGRPLLQLSPAASNQLREFLREQMCADSSGRPALLGAQYVPLLAAKLAPRLHLCAAGLKDQVSSNVMKEASGMARWLERTSARMKNQLAKTQHELVIRQKAQEMLALIPEPGIAKWRAISRRLHLQAKAFHQPTLDYLVATGQIVRHPDDSLERASSSKQT
jgi:hypothetical protein